ncbi:MAG: hypothetical protein ACK55Z_22185, partial [bacterium]
PPSSLISGLEAAAARPRQRTVSCSGGRRSAARRTERAGGAGAELTGCSRHQASRQAPLLLYTRLSTCSHRNCT